MGLGRTEVQKQLLLNSDAESVEVRLGPTAFLTENNAKSRKGDTLGVAGSRVMIGDSEVVLAREIPEHAHG